MQFVTAAAEQLAPPAPSVQLPTVAIPPADVVGVAVVTLPFPPPMVKVTVTPGTGLLNWSRTSTLGAVATAAPTAAVCASPALMLTCDAPEAVAEAVKVVVAAPAVADSVLLLVPDVVPIVQLPTVAMPLAFVVGVAVVTLPPPPVMAKVTVTLGTGLLFASLMSTEGATATLVPTVAVCGSSDCFVAVAGAPAVPVAVNVTVVRPVADAASVLVAAAELASVQLPTVATPLALVVAGVPVTALPVPPPVSAKLTETPATGLPFASVTVTAGAVATALPAVALCASPALLTMFAAGPAVNVTAPGLPMVTVLMVPVMLLVPATVLLSVAV